MDQECIITSNSGESECVITENGIEIWVSEKRQFSMPWPWLEEIKKELTKKQETKTEHSPAPIVERPQAEFGLKGYSQF